jgi:hypothetical protein
MNSILMRYSNFFLLEAGASAKAGVQLKGIQTCLWDPHSAYFRYAIHQPGGKTEHRGSATLDHVGKTAGFIVDANVQPQLVEIVSEHFAQVGFNKPFGLVAGKTCPLAISCGSYKLYFMPVKDKRTTISFNKVVMINQRNQEELIHPVQVTLCDSTGRPVAEKEGKFLKGDRLTISSEQTRKGGTWSLHVQQLGGPAILQRQELFVTLSGPTPVFTLKKEWAKKFTRLCKHKGAGRPKSKPARSTVSLHINARTGLSELKKKIPTRAPIHYELDYAPNHLDNSKYPDLIKRTRPDLLHFGRDVPMSHLFGPVPILGGENSVPVSESDLRLLSPKQLTERIGKFKKLNRRLHKSGAKLVMPYLSAITTAGDPDARKGLYHFLDRWDEYRECDIGKRPTGGPDKWSAINKDGSPRTWLDGLLSYPPYLGMNRYVCCVNHPQWQRWLKVLVELVARADYDGVFLDNCANFECFCDVCQKQFRKQLAAVYSKSMLKKLFGTENPEKLELVSEEYTRGYIESKRFWSQSLARLLVKLRNAGRRINPDFKLFANLNYPFHMYPYLRDAIDFCMFEQGQGQMDGAGRVFKPLAGHFFIDKYQHNMNIFRYTDSFAGKLSAVSLGCMRIPDIPLPGNARLEIGETAAGGGSGTSNFWSTLRLGNNKKDIAESKEAEKLYRFLDQQRSLYDNNVSAAEIGVLNFPWQYYYPQNCHRSTEYLANSLLTSGIPFDFVSEQGLARGVLCGLKYLFALDVKYMSENELNRIKAFVHAGGTLIIMGQFATHDLHMQKRKAASLLRGTNRNSSRQAGVFRYNSTEISNRYVDEILAETGTGYRVPDDAIGVSCALQVKRTSPPSYLLNLLDYNLPLNYIDTTYDYKKRNYEIALALPPKVKVRQVRVVDTHNTKSRKLKHDQAGSTVRFSVPGFDGYTACEILA